MPACPWAYSANPALRVLEWRFGDQLSWRLVLIGLREEVSEASRTTFDPARSVHSHMRSSGAATGCRSASCRRSARPPPGAGAERSSRRGSSTPGASGACSARSSSRNSRPRSCSTTTSCIREALRAVPGIDADAIVDRLDDPEVAEAYERDRAGGADRRGTAAEAQGKTSTSDGPCASPRPRWSSSGTACGSSPAAGSRSSPTTCCSPTSIPVCERDRSARDARCRCSSASRTA